MTSRPVYVDDAGEYLFGPASAGAIPLSIGAGETFTVAENTQVRAPITITSSGTIALDGLLEVG